MKLCLKCGHIEGFKRVAEQCAEVLGHVRKDMLVSQSVHRLHIHDVQGVEQKVWVDLQLQGLYRLLSAKGDGPGAEAAAVCIYSWRRLVFQQNLCRPALLAVGSSGLSGEVFCGQGLSQRQSRLQTCRKNGQKAAIPF